MIATMERPAVVRGEWNHSCGPSCPPGCTVNQVEIPAAPAPQAVPRWMPEGPIPSEPTLG